MRDDEVRIAVLCAACLFTGELIVLTGTPRFHPCPVCDGTGSFTIVCSADRAAELANNRDCALAQALARRRYDQIVAGLEGAGICILCFSSERISLIERDANNRPLRYAETTCPACSRSP